MSGGCFYPARAGVDVDIDGGIWPGSPLDQHYKTGEHDTVCVLGIGSIDEASKK